MSIVVLVAEDNPLIRMLALDALADAGWATIEAEHAKQARTILEDRWSSIDVLFSDVHMPPPAMTGMELVREVHQRWPRIGLLVTSGHQMLAERDLPKGCRFISKPYFQRHVVEHIQELAADTGLRGDGALLWDESAPLPSFRPQALACQ